MSKDNIEKRFIKHITCIDGRTKMLPLIKPNGCPGENLVNDLVHLSNWFLRVEILCELQTEFPARETLRCNVQKLETEYIEACKYFMLICTCKMFFFGIVMCLFYILNDSGSK